MSLLFPFFILSIISYFVSFKYKISSAKSYLISSITIMLLFIFFGKFGYLNFFNDLLRYSTVLLFIYLIWKKKFNSKCIKNLIFFFVIYLFLIFVCKDLIYYKYDEFSEYGITTKLIFTENNLPSNIDYLQKGSHHKINFISYFHYFFLKNSTELFQESITYIAHSFFIIIILLNILNFIEIQNIKKFFIFILFYFLIYTLGPGLDRLYLDTILGLIIALLLLTSFKKNKYRSDYYLIFLLTLTLPIIKPNGILIVIGLFSIILIENIFKKKFTIIMIMLVSLTSHHLVSKFYFIDLNLKNKPDKSHHIHESSAFNLSQSIQIIQFQKNLKNYDLDAEFIYKFSNKQINDLIKNGIYHSKTFLIFNKIFSKIDLNFQLIELPLNIFFWLSVIILIPFFINKKKNSKDLYLISILYLGFVVFYYFVLIFWGIKHNLITDNFNMNVSWQRHLGSLIIGIIFFLLVEFFKIYKNFKIIFLFLFLSLCITLPNSLRLFVPNKIIKDDIFWKTKIEERSKLSFISQEISSKIDGYSNLLLAFHKNDQPYFEQILNYELIKFNTMNIDARNIIFFAELYEAEKNNNNFYLVTDTKYDLIKIKSKLNNIFNNVSDYKNISLIKRYKIDHLEIYEIIIEK